MSGKARPTLGEGGGAKARAGTLDHDHRMDLTCGRKLPLSPAAQRGSRCCSLSQTTPTACGPASSGRVRTAPAPLPPPKPRPRAGTRPCSAAVASARSSGTVRGRRTPRLCDGRHGGGHGCGWTMSRMLMVPMLTRGGRRCRRACRAHPHRRRTAAGSGMCSSGWPRPYTCS